MNTDKIYAEAIANEYAPKDTSKVVALKKLDRKAKSKANIFLIMNIILWSGIAFLLSFVAGVFCGYSAEWVEWTVIITGYAGIGIGFFGGVIYYMRQA